MKGRQPTTDEYTEEGMWCNDNNGCTITRMRRCGTGFSLKLRRMPDSVKTNIVNNNPSLHGNLKNNCCMF